jgi:pimeloyl-ACP methyl ester carboxylesterase
LRELKQIRVSANGINFVALEMGDGPLVLCLHGFPDNAYSYRHQMPALADAGYRVVAPFMRGYAPTSPAPDGNYQVAALAYDILGLIDALGGAPAVVIGHDWGAVAAYPAAATAGTEKISKLVALAIPYGPKFLEGVMSSYDQLKRSWYIHFFQGFLADAVVPLDRCAFVRRLWQDWSPGWKFPEETMDSVRDTLSSPGVVEAALAHYRALLDPTHHDPALAEVQGGEHRVPIEVPSMYLHGVDDGCMGIEMAEGMGAMFPRGLRFERIVDAGHFLHQEKPELVNRKILEFLGDD